MNLIIDSQCLKRSFCDENMMLDNLTNTFFCIVFTATVLAECPVAWHRYEDSCYFFSHENLNWFNAQVGV